MFDWRRPLAAGLLVSLVATAAAQVAHGLPGAAPRAPLTVFGAEPRAGAAAAEPLLRLDGALRGVARAAATPQTLGLLHALNPALHLRLAAPSVTPEVLVDVVAAADPAATQRLLEGLGMRNLARVSNLIGGWLPVW